MVIKKIIGSLLVLTLLAGCSFEKVFSTTLNASAIGATSMYNFLADGNLEAKDITNYESNDTGEITFIVKNKIHYHRDIDIEGLAVTDKITSAFPLNQEDIEVIHSFLEYFLDLEQPKLVEDAINTAIETNSNQTLEFSPTNDDSIYADDKCEVVIENNELKIYYLVKIK